MGLTVAISNALSGIRVGNQSLEVVSRNVSNAGTPGYHRQSVSVVEASAANNSNYVRSGGVTRAFDQSLQTYYTRQVSDTTAATTKANYLSRLQTVLGMPGDATSLDTVYSAFQSALQGLATSPDDYTVRAQVISAAQALTSTLNTLSGTVQELRQETEQQITGAVADLNNMVGALQDINAKLGNQTFDSTSRATLLDQRDRLVSGISEIIDVQVDYRSDGTVALMTRSGVGVLDKKASIFEFQPVAGINASSQFSLDPNESSVGKLTIKTPSGLTLDLMQQNVLQSGELKALVELRDKTLTEVQDQLDQIATGLATAFSTIDTGTAVPSGFEINTSDLGAGNALNVQFVKDGKTQSVQITDFTDPVAALGAALDDAFAPDAHDFTISQDAVTGVLSVTSATIPIKGMSASVTAQGTQNAGLGLALFVESGTGATGAGQQLGFAGRIRVNAEVVADSTLLVQATNDMPIGDTTRVSYLAEQLGSMKFTLEKPTASNAGNFQLSGTVANLISQTLNYQGSSIASALSDQETKALALEVTGQRMQSEYGVDVDEEMSRLLELQNAYAANARVISIVQELLNQLMNMI